MNDTLTAPVAHVRPEAETHPFLAALGGRKGLVDGALPPVVFVATNAVAGLVDAGPVALRWAIGASLAVALGIALLRAARGESLKGALRGSAGLAVAIAFAAWTGRARDFFLPGIYVDGLYGVVFAASAVVGRPIVGYVYGVLFRLRSWRDDRRLRRVLTAATFVWAGVFTLRATAQAYFYVADRPELLAVAKLGLGWPLTAAALALTLAAARRARRPRGVVAAPSAPGAP